MKKQNLIHKALMVQKLFAHHITDRTIETHITFLHVMGSFLIMKVLYDGENFVTKKIISTLTKIKYGFEKKLTLGNLYSKRDWGHAEDYVEAIHKILQQRKPDDYVIATGKQYSIKQFVNLTASRLNLKLKWTGKGLKEKALSSSKKIIIDVNKNILDR